MYAHMEASVRALSTCTMLMNDYIVAACGLAALVEMESMQSIVHLLTVG
jgi:hypothetical protein